MKTVLQSEKECIVCGTTYNLHDHHIFFGARKKASERRGLKCWLCAPHHNMSNDGVHHNRILDLKLKKFAQKYYESNYGTREDFIKEFGKSYL